LLFRNAPLVLDHPLLPLARYCWSPPAQAWIVASVDVAADAKKKGPLRVLSLNLWFETHKQRERTTALVRELERLDPDVVAMQEATNSALSLLYESAFVRHTYAVSSIHLTQVGCCAVR
jgi:hypothetical protein